MKKSFTNAVRIKGGLFYTRMKFLLIFLLIGIIQANASIYSQVTRLDINLKNASIDEVLYDFSSKGDFEIIYRSDLFDNSPRIDVELEDVTIVEFLDEYIVPKGFKYSIDDKTVIITDGKEKEIDVKKSMQDENILIEGKVTDKNGVPLPGATITIVGTTRGIITDNDGTFSIKAKPNDKLVCTFIGMTSQIVDVNGRIKINIELASKSEELEDVTVVAFSKQKKESVIASIETVNPVELKIPSSNLTTALAGRMAGIISYQRSGEPGEDNAQFFIRGVTSFGNSNIPLILIDGIELSTNDLARLHPDDIASFSIMKDATATALYGARGANGVILVTTKEGSEGKAKFSVRYESSLSQPTRNIKLTDPITYMQAHNEAYATRSPLLPLPYTQEKVENTINGTNPYVYPATNWQNELLKNFTMNQRFNFNISGGGKIARYYLSGGISHDNGILKVDKRNDFNSNISLKSILIRSNVNINLTKTTEAVVRLHGNFDDYRGPINGGSDMYRLIMRTNPVLFPAYFEPDEEHKYVNHILFGNAGDGNYLNPYAEMVKGYKEYSKSLMLAQFELKQDFSFIIKGLKARLLGNTTRNSYFDVTRNYEPFYYAAKNFNNRTNEYELELLNSETGYEYLNYSQGEKQVRSTFYAEAAIDYFREFSEKHTVTGLLVGIIRHSLDGSRDNLQESLPNRNLGVSGRFTYAFDKRYFAEFNFGYNGTERFSEKERFGFFPSVGAGWFVSNEKFWVPYLKTISKLKLKFTYGLVGNDAIGNAADRFFYLSNVNMNDANRGYSWGTDGDYHRDGISISRYANDKITWETARKTNLGLELGLFNKFEINADLFKEYRTNILMDRIQLSTFGLQANTRANVGEASSSGIDISVDYQENFSNGVWITARGNFTYARGVFEKYEEPDYSATPWLSHEGKALRQEWGYVAERLFVDDWEVLNSPEQQLGSIAMGGDIKYIDINGDDKITSLDQVPIGYPTTPEIIYGFGASVGYKAFDFSVFFQGSARSSFWIDAEATSPFINYKYWGENNDKIMNNAFLEAYANDHWSESNRDVYALWPRLSYRAEWNNLQRNTWFMQDGAFLRLKSMEIGFTLNQKQLDRLHMKSLRIYASGTNLFSISHFKLWDPEMGGNGLGYPIQRVINLGIQVSF
ncbi:MAG: TonB-dependent receptor [Prolixibacteraceae bacterium]|nr:TonB-dependent receptor [Prolixibacteraceae bacterium]